MATKLILKNAAVNPAKWTDEFLAKVADAGDHAFFTKQILAKWWKLGLDEVFAAGAQFELTLDENGFVWKLTNLTDKARKLLDKDEALLKVEQHKGKCSGKPAPAPPPDKPANDKPVPDKPPVPTATQKGPSNPTPPAKVEAKPTPTPKQLAQFVIANVLSGSKDASAYARRAQRLLAEEFTLGEEHVKTVEALAAKQWFTKAEEPTEKPGAKPTARTVVALTNTEVANVDAALREAQRVANGELLDNAAQTNLGDAICTALGGKYPTHSRGGGHKGSFNATKTIQQQLSNIAENLSANKRDSLRVHLETNWAPYYV